MVADAIQLTEKLAQTHAIPQSFCSSILNDRTISHRVAKRDSHFDKIDTFPLDSFDNVNCTF